MNNTTQSEYTYEQVEASVKKSIRLAQLAYVLAEVHIGDGDELGEIARELWPLTKEVLAFMDKARDDD